ncbi:MAG: tol-pal system protein YbgF [Thiobacillus sp.]|uniref:tol-pal system protein YbgF n=1 Tax=Thiobacillus sp. TaxID=924 RepID=UPI0027333D69|nr:tol-pal system protein YbgF [Thiobacillus sp.]MDP3584817.1 tol-pal system protein YbgF [Thiobacillus sp.]
MATSKRLLRRGGLVLVGAFALAQPAWALFGNAELTRQTQALQQRADAVDARLGKIEAALQDNRKLLDLLQEVETLKAENARLRGLAEMQQHQLETLGKRQNDLYADLDQRLADLTKAAQPAATADGVAVPAGTPPADASTASRNYETALALFREANYPGAIAGFGSFLKAHPDSELAANAQYWIGYSYYALKDYKTALAQQQKLVATYPGNPKVPDALFNIATNQIALEQTAAARKTLEEIVAKHPGTPAATLAARRLSTLK